MASVISHNPCHQGEPRLAALILAAGYSSRMGSFKPLLRIGSSAAIEMVVRLFLDAGIPDVHVVLGHRANEIRPLAEAVGARCVLNPDFDKGMFTSVCAGIASLPAAVDASFIIPADIPLVRVNTIRQLARSCAASHHAIVYPAFRKHRGHPPLIARKILDEAAGYGLDGRLSALLASHEHDACNLEVPDEGILRDMDTPDEFVGIRNLAIRREVPTVNECEAILDIYRVDAQVIRHSRKVAEVAERIAVSLAESGINMDPRLARAGGILHDLAKGRPDHANAGAGILRELDFHKVAGVVAVHTDFDFSERRLDEAAIVYLADKLVSGENIVGIEQRFCRALERFRDNPQALDAALRRRATAKAIVVEIEKRLGAALPQLIGNENAEAMKQI